MKIIVAEDDALTREIIVKILKNLGHEVRAFATGDEAWAANSEDPAEVIFSDWLIPGMDGLELCRNIRGKEKQSKNYTYFILATGTRTSNTDHDAAVRAGVDDFLIKPINPDEVWRRLFVARRFLDFTRQLRRVRSLLPACAVCKKIRDDNEYWNDFEAYIEEQPDKDADIFICADCQHKQAEAAARHR